MNSGHELLLNNKSFRIKLWYQSYIDPVLSNLPTLQYKVFPVSGKNHNLYTEKHFPPSKKSASYC